MADSSPTAEGAASNIPADALIVLPTRNIVFFPECLTRNEVG